MNIKSELSTAHQVCLAHTIKLPYQSFKSFALLLVSALIIAFFIDTTPRFSSHNTQTATILVATPFILCLLIWLHAFFQRCVHYNSDLFITRKGVCIPDFEQQQDYFIAYSDFKSATIYYFPLTPLFKFGPYIKTHFSLTNSLGVTKGLHCFNTNDVDDFIHFLHAQGVVIKYRVAPWPLVYLATFIIFFLLASLV